MENVLQEERRLLDQLREGLQEMEGVEIFGPPTSAQCVSTLSFRCEAFPANELGGILDQAFDVAVRPGLHCAPYVHQEFGTFPEGTVRVSPGHSSTEQDIDHLLNAVREITLGT